jgi:hypothetical protein
MMKQMRIAMKNRSANAVMQRAHDGLQRSTISAESVAVADTVAGMSWRVGPRHVMELDAPQSVITVQSLIAHGQYHDS